MKMIIAIIRDSDSECVTQALTEGDFRVTRVSSTGGLLRRGVTTLILGIKDERVEAAIQLMKDNCATPVGGEKRATVFVVPVESFLQV
jgi:uncharacterized protein YaaQ